MLADRSVSFTLAKSDSEHEAILQASAYSAITLPILRSLHIVQNLTEQKHISITMKKIAISILSTALRIRSEGQIEA